MVNITLGELQDKIGNNNFVTSSVAVEDQSVVSHVGVRVRSSGIQWYFSAHVVVDDTEAYE